MKKLFLYLIFCIATFLAYSQTDTLRITDRIAAMEYSKSDIISKSRRLLLQDFQTGNKEGVKQTLQYLATKVDDEYHWSLWDYERYLLLYWIGDYTQIVTSIELAALDTTTHNTRPAIYPSDDFLGTNLQKDIKDTYYYEIIKDYETLHFTPDTNDFLYVFLNKLLGSTSIKELNNLSDKFVKDYPYSPLAEASKKFISYKLAPGDLGWGISFGGGSAFTSGKITNYMKLNRVINAGLDFYYKKIFVSLMFNSSLGTIKKNIEIKQNGRVWGAGKDMDIFKIAPLIGYKIIEYKRLSMIPFAGISFNTASPSTKDRKEDSSLEGLNLGTSISPIMGVDIDWILNSLSGYNGYVLPTIYSLGFRAAYLPSLITTQGAEMRGQQLFVGLTLKMNIFQIKRVY